MEAALPHVVSPTSIIISCCFIIPVRIWYSGSVFTLPVLINSGVAGNFIDQDSVACLQLPVIQLQRPIKVSAINGHPVGSGLIAHSTHPVHLQASTLLHEQITLLLMVTASQPLVLGLPWLKLHDPVIS